MADALSRQHEDVQVRVLISYPIWQQGKELQVEDSKDPSLTASMTPFSRILYGAIGMTR